MILRVLVSMTDKAAPIAQIYAQLPKDQVLRGRTQEKLTQEHCRTAGWVGVQNEWHDYDA